MTKMRNINLLVWMLIGMNICTQAQIPYTPVNEDRILVRAFPFLNFTYSARESSLAESGIAISPDANAGLMNPAKLLYLDSLKSKNKKGLKALEKDSTAIKRGMALNFTPYYRNLIGGMNLWAASIFQVKNRKAYGINLRYFDAGTAAFYSKSRVFIKKYPAKEIAISGFYSFTISANHKHGLSIGMNYVYSNLSRVQYDDITTKPARALSGNFYYFYDGRIGRGEKRNWTNYGASLTNVGGKVSYGDNKKRSFQPTLLKIGVAQNWILGDRKRDAETILMLTLDANKLLVPTPPVRSIDGLIIDGRDESKISGLGSIIQSWGTAPNGFRERWQEIYYSVGAELDLKKLLAFRAGYYFQHRHKGDMQYLSFGVGAKFDGLSLDIAYLLPNKRNEVLKNTFRLSAMYQFGH